MLEEIGLFNKSESGTADYSAGFFSDPNRKDYSLESKGTESPIVFAAGTMTEYYSTISVPSKNLLNTEIIFSKSTGLYRVKMPILHYLFCLKSKRG